MALASIVSVYTFPENALECGSLAAGLVTGSGRFVRFETGDVEDFVIRHGLNDQGVDFTPDTRQ